MNLSKRIYKPVITILVLSAILCSGSLWVSVQAATGTRVKSKAAIAPPPPISITVTITIGRASRGCRGFGICKISIGKLTEDRTVEAQLSSAGNGRVQLSLVGKPPEEAKTLFVDQDIQLGPEISQKLGYKSVTIRKGQYTFGRKSTLLNARSAR